MARTLISPSAVPTARNSSWRNKVRRFDRAKNDGSAYFGLKNLVALIVSVPAATFVQGFYAGLEVVDSHCFERCCDCVTYARIDLRVPESHCRLDKESLQDMDSCNGVQDGEVLRAKINDGHRLPIVAEDLPSEAKFAGVVEGNFQKWDAPTGKEKRPYRYTVDSRQEIIAFASRLFEITQQSGRGQLHAVEVGQGVVYGLGARSGWEGPARSLVSIKDRGYSIGYVL